MSNEKMTERQLDLLKEIGSIGSASAATALAELTDMKINIVVPNVEFIPLENIGIILGGMEKIYFVSVLEISGDIKGTIFLLFSLEHAEYLCDILLDKINEKNDTGIDSELFQSCLKESANILCGAYISALAEMSNLKISTSVPFLAKDMVGAILDFIFINIAQQSEEALIIKTNVNVSGANIEGLFLLFPNSQSLRRMFEVFGVKE